MHIAGKNINGELHAFDGDTDGATVTDVLV